MRSFFILVAQAKGDDFGKMLSDNKWMFIIGGVVLLVGIFFLSMFSGNIATVMAEQFPTRVRTSGIAFPYALAVAMFGGTAPFITTYLISIHNYLGVAGYVIVASAISAVIYLTMPETRTKVLTQT